MTGGSDDARTPRDERRSVDAAWDELLEDSDEDRGDSGPRDVRPVTGGHVMASQRSASGGHVMASQRPVTGGHVMASQRPVSGGHVMASQRSASGGLVMARPDADDEMARLMAGAAPRLPTIDPDTVELRVDAPDEPAQQPKLGAPGEPVVAPNAGATPGVVTAKAEQPGVPGAPTPVERATPSRIVVGKDALADAPPKAPVPGEEPVVQARASRPSLRVIEVAPVPASLHRADERAARASRPAEPTSAEPEATRGLPWAWIGIGAIALGGVAYFATRDDASASGRDRTPSAPVAERTPQEPVKANPKPSTPTPIDAQTDDAGSEDEGGADSGDPGRTKPPTPRSSKDPREPPTGTPPEIAAVFRRLPVGPGDRAPVGGIGATGIHVDHIAMGSETQGATCRGRTDDFSVSAGDRAGVCVRVVHSREKEELQVLWQKHGGSTRRSKMVVLPMHAYRTRGYLSLRSEYIGDWTVRILSSDDVELARHEFTVVP